MSLENFTSSATRRAPAPNDSWGAPNNGWRVTLKNGRGNRYTVPFFKGVGLPDTAPETLEVLNCLARDAAGYREAPTFEEWANDYGYDPDSRAAHKTFKACRRVSDRLESFLTDEEYEALLELDI